MYSKPANLQNSAVLRMLEEQEQGHRITGKCILICIDNINILFKIYNPKIVTCVERPIFKLCLGVYVMLLEDY